MVMTNREQILLDTQRTRAQAAAVLQDLIEARAACEATLAAERRPDLVKLVTGQSSLDVAIAEMRKLVESLDRTISESARELDQDDRDVASAGDGLEAVVVAGRLAVAGRLVARAG